jgi:predicted MFS family arabinose efflux permease
MKIQKLAIAALVGTVFLFLVDWVWYGMLMKDSMTMPNARPEPDMMWLVLSYIVFSVAFASIYGAWNGGSSKVNSGLNFGLWIGLMVGLSMNLMWYSLTTTVTLNQALMDSVYSIVKFILLGILMAYVAGGAHGDRAGGGRIPG